MRWYVGGSPMTRAFFWASDTFKYYTIFQSMKADTRDDLKAVRSLYSGHQFSAALTALCLSRRAS